MNKRILFIATASVGMLWVGPINAEDAAGRGDGEHFTGKEQIVDLPGGTQMTFVWIEPGIFQMGSRFPENEWLKELESIALDEGSLPVHEVEISAGFWLGKYVVTQEQWEAVMGTTPWRNADNADKELVQSNPSHPAVYVSWNDAQELIQRLNSAAGEEVYRLPTEAEWEYACRAGTSTLWSFGNEEGAFSTLWKYDKDKVSLPHYTWYRDNTLGKNEKYAHAVGQHRPNAWGLHDMHGNVWEWVQDWFDPDYYKRSPRVDPVGPTYGSLGSGPSSLRARMGDDATDSLRVLRGGDFTDPVIYLRSATRTFKEPYKRDSTTSVRLYTNFIVVVGIVRSNSCSTKRSSRTGTSTLKCPKTSVVKRAFSRSPRGQ